MAPDSKLWKEIDQLLGGVLDQREAAERARLAKVKRLLARNSARRSGSKPSQKLKKPTR
jgi:hypothetical protein